MRELAVEVPNATRVLEKFGIDYCCGGQRSLEQACSAARLPLDEVVRALESAASAPMPESGPPSGSLAELIDHIVGTHHKFTREEIMD